MEKDRSDCPLRMERHWVEYPSEGFCRIRGLLFPGLNISGVLASSWMPEWKQGGWAQGRKDSNGTVGEEILPQLIKCFHRVKHPVVLK